MSEGDQNCLLSVLWGNGSSVALRYSERYKTPIVGSTDEELNTRRLVSNDYIKAMRNGNEEWDWDNTTAKRERTEAIVLNYAHLSVSPREIVEVEGIEWDSGIAVLVPLMTEKTDKLLKLYLDDGKKIYDSIARDALCEEIMRDLRESEKGFRKTNTTIGAFGSRHTRFSDSDDDVPERQPRRWKLLFEEANPETEVEKFIKNVGPSPAMKNIFSFEMEAKNKPYRSVATGNMPLICPEKGRKIVPAFKRTLKPSVQGALGRQRNLFTCLEKDEGDEGGKNLFPYMENVFVMDWYSRLERHLFRIKCSGYGKRIGLEFKELELFNMYAEKMEEKMKKMVSFRTPYLEESIAAEKWYERWIKDYRAELSMEAKKREKYKDIRTEMIHKKYDNIRRSKRRRPPAQWLYENGLIVC